MQELSKHLNSWLEKGLKIAIASVVNVHGSASRPLGAKLVVNENMDFFGSVSGGCIEGDVIDHALKVIKNGEPCLLKYGISNDTAWEFGLACGGEIEVFIETFQPIHFQILEKIKSHQYFAVATILSGEAIGQKLLQEADQPPPICEAEVNADLMLQRSTFEALKLHKPIRTQSTLDGEIQDIFVDIFLPPAKLIIIGAVHIAIPLVSFANTMGFDTIVIDARSAFSTRERFPHADQLISDWPASALEKISIDENTFIAFLSHDEKMDNPALNVVLGSKARYIGVLGSKKTHTARVKKLKEMGLPDAFISKIHAPIGLDLAAVGSEEIALATMAQIIAIKNNQQV